LKKIFAVVLVVSLILALSGCSEAERMKIGNNAIVSSQNK